MDLTQPLVALAGAAATLALLAYLVWGRRPRDKAPVAVANTDLLRGLSAYRAALRRYRVKLAAAAAAALAVAGCAAFALGRPQQERVDSPQQRNRDIMLCLDVSGSMMRADAAVVRTFQQLVKGFQGERIGLVIFDSTAVSVFPLTDDYEFTTEQLGLAAKVFTGDTNPWAFFEGTFNATGSSLIGDGLASCVQSFDQLDTQRARSVVLATDNQLAGDPLFTLDDAGALAITRGVRVYGINPADQSGDKDSQQMRSVVMRTGGGYFALTQPEAVSGIIGQVQSQEATLIEGAPRRYRMDAPAVVLLGAGVAVFGLLVAGRRWWA